MNSTFDLLLYNKATKDYYFIKGLRDTSITPATREFKDFTMPQGAPFGEYQYFCFEDLRRDTGIIEDEQPLKCLITTQEGNVPLELIKPEMGILRYGECCGEKQTTLYLNTDVSYLYL
jgi:hypothetical protein